MAKKENYSDLLYHAGSGYDRLSAKDLKAMEAYCEDYKKFLNVGKTERLCVLEAIRLAEAAGYKPLGEGKKLKAGDKVYWNNRGKSLCLAYIGTESLHEGVVFGIGHIDSPHFDLRPRPLYEDTDLAFMKTHRYGHPQEFEWVNIPLAIHGVVTLRGGKTVEVHLGENEDEPEFMFCNLLMHMSDEQYKKSLKDAITAETLNLLVGSRPLGDEGDSKRVKLSVLKAVFERYGMREEDFMTADLALIPAGKARDLGFDRSMIAAYGHDDRVCSYAALRPMLEMTTPRRTCVCVLTDREETGSTCNTGMKSRYLDLFMERLCAAQKVSLAECYYRSLCISADVVGAYDPNFKSVFTPYNAYHFNRGACVYKYSGKVGKGGGSEAQAELVGHIRDVFEDAGVLWQSAEFGLPAIAHTGTICAFMTERNVDAIDVGVPLLSMHAPREVAAKLDCYMMYRAMKAVYENG